MNRNRLTILAILSLFLLIIFSKTQAQSPKQCALSLEQSPEIRGFKLGATTEQLKRRHPKVVVPEADGNGYAVSDYEGFFNPSVLIEILGGKDGKDLSGLKLGFLDNQLVRFRVTYSGLTTEWDNVGQFIESIAKSLSLPNISKWTVVDNITREIICDKFKVVVRLEPKVGRYELQKPSITLMRLDVDEILSQREKTRKARQREGFKP